MKRKRSFKQNRLFVQNNPASPRICPELAKEIGLNESILLLQYEFWIATEGEERDGFLWVRKPVREIKAVLTFWGTSTINRIIQHLIDRHYCVAGEFDEDGDKNGRWIRFDFNALASLNSIKIICAESGQTICATLDNDSSHVGTNTTPDGTNNPPVLNIDQEELRVSKNVARALRAAQIADIGTLIQSLRVRSGTLKREQELSQSTACRRLLDQGYTVAQIQGCLTFLFEDLTQKWRTTAPTYWTVVKEIKFWLSRTQPAAPSKPHTAIMRPKNWRDLELKAGDPEWKWMPEDFE